MLILKKFDLWLKIQIRQLTHDLLFKSVIDNNQLLIYDDNAYNVGLKDFNSKVSWKKIRHRNKKPESAKVKLF